MVVGCESGSRRWNRLANGKLEDTEQVSMRPKGITNSEAKAPQLLLVLWLFVSLKLPIVVIHVTS